VEFEYGDRKKRAQCENESDSPITNESSTAAIADDEILTTERLQEEREAKIAKMLASLVRVPGLQLDEVDEIQFEGKRFHIAGSGIYHFLEKFITERGGTCDNNKLTLSHNYLIVYEYTEGIVNRYNKAIEWRKKGKSSVIIVGWEHFKKLYNIDYDPIVANFDFIEDTFSEDLKQKFRSL
jgi:hypothetical protein